MNPLAKATEEKIMKTGIALLTGALLFSASPFTGHAEEGTDSNVMFIFDSSGSMKKKIAGGESRSDAAKRAMVSALSQMSQGSNLGLIMYGHRRAKDCTDIELVTPLGTGNSGSLADSILRSRPNTTLAGSVMASIVQPSAAVRTS
jgi:Ca-activated chloride channel family protein